ncbi:MAG: ribose 5-phosphate isomerase A, partial [Thermoplasmata archaeon]|nr:ribose 5-phosphate isomerase A [Thermoplasmata archaeon]
TLEDYPKIDLTIDGADEVDQNLNLIKGMGGALLREKVVAMVSKREIIIADGSKEVQMLGTKSALPIEILPFALAAVKPKLEELCVEAILREKEGETFVSDNGNYIIDCKFDAIAEPEELESRLNNIPGVVENGLFLGLANMAILGTSGGLKIME